MEVEIYATNLAQKNQAHEYHQYIEKKVEKIVKILIEVSSF
jgi:hypothetical protein